jgi:hypothetical protein
MLATDDEGAVMALSDYERRVLEELEDELAGLETRRFIRLRVRLAALRVTFAALLVAGACVAIAASAAPGWLAVPLAAVGGAVAGVGVSFRRLRRRDRH